MRSPRPAGAPRPGTACGAAHLTMSTHSSHAMRRSDPLMVLRYLDIIVVVLAAPFVILTGLPVLGYVVGAAIWILQRFAGAREDGVMAAVVVLVAYTVYLVTSLAIRSFERNPPRS